MDDSGTIGQDPDCLQAVRHRPARMRTDQGGQVDLTACRRPCVLHETTAETVARLLYSGVPVHLRLHDFGIDGSGFANGLRALRRLQRGWRRGPASQTTRRIPSPGRPVADDAGPDGIPDRQGSASCPAGVRRQSVDTCHGHTGIDPAIAIAVATVDPHRGHARHRPR